MSYDQFIRSKINLDSRSGFKVDPDRINPQLYPHQRDIVRWAIEGGRRAIRLGRFGRAAELNPDYVADGVGYLEAAEREMAMPTLFDFDPLQEAA